MTKSVLRFTLLFESTKLSKYAQELSCKHLGLHANLGDIFGGAHRGVFERALIVLMLTHRNWSILYIHGKTHTYIPHEN